MHVLFLYCSLHMNILNIERIIEYIHCFGIYKIINTRLYFTVDINIASFIKSVLK